MAGICITDLPQEMAGTLALGSRILRPGDVLTAEQVGQMTFTPVLAEENRELQVGYLPIYENSVGPDTALTLSIRGKENKPPVAEDCAVETYKNLSVTGKLKVSDPEGQAMTFRLIRQPKRGAVELGADGSVVVDAAMQTTLPGLYAAGDCTGGLKQIAKAVHEGTQAGLSAIQYIRDYRKTHPDL